MDRMQLCNPNVKIKIKLKRLKLLKEEAEKNRLKSLPFIFRSLKGIKDLFVFSKPDSIQRKMDVKLTLRDKLHKMLQDSSQQANAPVPNEVISKILSYTSYNRTYAPQDDDKIEIRTDEMHKLILPYLKHKIYTYDLNIETNNKSEKFSKSKLGVRFLAPLPNRNVLMPSMPIFVE